MSGQTSLKAQNAWLIRAILLVHGLAFAYVAFEPFVLAQLAGPDVLEKVRAALAPGSLSLAIIVLAKLILLGLMPARLRDRLIHWRWRHPLPGARAFSKFGPADPRVDMARLERTYGPLPTEPGDQGRMFYTIYSAHAGSVGVLDSHKSYLAARDIGIINLLLFFLLPGFAYWATYDFSRTAIYAAALFFSYLLMAIAAHVYGARLVENALAAASANHS
jgi:hypothetical protein